MHRFELLSEGTELVLEVAGLTSEGLDEFTEVYQVFIVHKDFQSVVHDLGIICMCVNTEPVL